MKQRERARARQLVLPVILVMASLVTAAAAQARVLRGVTLAPHGELTHRR
jgi:hypothetical protein